MVGGGEGASGGGGPRLGPVPQKQAKEEMKTVLGNFCFSVLDDHEMIISKQEDWAGERERQDFLDARRVGAAQVSRRQSDEKDSSPRARGGWEPPGGGAGPLILFWV